MLLVILETLGRNSQQITIIAVAALGINSTLYMPEMMNNVTGGIVCTNAVAHNEGLLTEKESV